MARVVVIGMVALLTAASVLGQSTIPPQPTNPQDSSSRERPDAAPSPPDTPTPDLGTQPAPPSKSKAKKIANKFDPHCIDVIFHACWSSPELPQPGKPVSEEQERTQQAAKDIDVGYYYLNQKNYVAAESRLKEAVELKPDTAAAWIGLGQAQQKLGKTDDARTSYEAYLKLEPDGHDAEKVKKALTELK
jgi:tetratricopeptide (TPR) repeat protein